MQLRSPLRSFFLIAAALGVSVLLLELRSGNAKAGLMPQPLDLTGSDRETSDGMDRKAWVRSMHSVPRGVRWTRQERLNAEARWASRLELDEQAFLPDTGARWSEVGSNNQAGQTRTIAVSSNGDLYLGSASGGLWKGSLENSGWVSLSDQVGGGADEVVCLPSVVLGEPDALLVRRGGRVTQSSDGGITWNRPKGLDGMTRGNRMVHAPAGPVWVLGAHLHKGNPRSVLWVSHDRGRSFEVAYSPGGIWRGDLLGRNLPSGQFELLWLHSKSIYQSLDLGQTWIPRARFDTVAPRGHLAVGGAPSPKLYVTLETEKGWRIWQGDAETMKMKRMSDPPDCWGPIAALPLTADSLWVGGLEAHGSRNGGSTYQRVNAWQEYYSDPTTRLHADIRGIQTFEDPMQAGGELLFIHTDGGTYLSKDRGETFHNLCKTNLRIGQVYDTLTLEDGIPWVWIGTQDQGLQGGPYDPVVDGREVASFRQWVSGDYGYLTPISRNQSQPAGLLASYPGFVLWFAGRGNRDPQRLLWPEGAQTQWMPPLYPDPVSSQAAWFLGERLYRYERDEDGSWTVLPFGDLDLSERQAQRLVAMGHNGAGNTVYVADDRGGLHRSRDGGEHFERRGNTRSDGLHLLARCLWVDPSQPTVVWIAGTGYASCGIIVSRDGGSTFEDSAPGLPKTLVHDVALGRDGQMYAACDAGPFVLDREHGRWMALDGEGGPNTIYSSVERVLDGQVMRFGTFGRGVWDYAIPADAVFRSPR